MTAKAKRIEQTFAKERYKLFGFIRKFVPSKEDAEDILQDVFFQFVNYADIEIIEKVNNWLFKTAKNRIIDRSRKKKAEAFSDTITEGYNEEESYSIEDFLPSIELTPEDLFLRDEFKDKFDEALAELPAGQREVFYMNEIDGLSFKEISELTGLSVNTLLSRKHYAIKQLKQKLNKYLDR